MNEPPWPVRRTRVHVSVSTSAYRAQRRGRVRCWLQSRHATLRYRRQVFRGRMGREMRLRTEGLTSQEIDGELAILHLASSGYLTTNGSGALLAKVLVDAQSEEGLSAALVAEWNTVSRARRPQPTLQRAEQTVTRQANGRGCPRAPRRAPETRRQPTQWRTPKLPLQSPSRPA